MNAVAIAQATVPVLENVLLARNTLRLRFDFPQLAVAIKPGQFLMLRVPRRNDPLLGRAFALYDTVADADGRPSAVDVVYAVVGKVTGLMANLRAGDAVEVWGPLGNGFPNYAGIDHLIMVAGGIGQTPFLALANRVLGKRSYGGQPVEKGVKEVSLFYGVRTKDLAAGVADFESAGVKVHFATDDGSAGFHGFVTQQLDAERATLGTQRSLRIVGCGPEPMLHSLAKLAERWKVPCDLSLETPMACGVGVCFSCVTKVKTDSGWDYRRVCVDGPIFEAGALVT